MAAEIKNEFPDAVITMVPSRGGRFEVMRDGSAVYEKSKTNRHAAEGEIIQLLKETNSK